MEAVAQKLVGQVADIELRSGGRYEAVTIHQASNTGVLIHKDSVEGAILIGFHDIKSIDKGW